MTGAKRRIKTLASAVGLDLVRRSNVPFGVNWQNDAWSLVGTDPNPVVFDIGANIGQTAFKLIDRFPSAEIYCFEPVPSTFKRLSLNLSKYPQIRCVNFALGEAEGQAEMTVDRDRMNTLVSGTSSGATAQVAVATVDGFCTTNGIAKIDLLKIDTEGFETAVLRGAERMLASGSIDLVLAECDFITRRDQPHGNFFEIHELLTGYGFRVVGLYNGGLDRNSGWIWGDVLMIRQRAGHEMEFRLSPFDGI